MSTTVLAMVTETTAISLYLVYAFIAIGLVIYLARTLYRNGALFLKDVFHDSAIAGAVNHLLVVGFYLLNLGYALLIYQLQIRYDSVILAFNELVVRIGILLLSLGVIHLLNMAVFWKIRGNAAPKLTGAQALANRLAEKEFPPPPAFPVNPA